MSGILEDITTAIGYIGSSAFSMAYQISPITLVSGIAANIPGGMMPVVSITDGIDPITGALISGLTMDTNEYFAYYQPLPGGTLGENEIATYPFANQSVAGNAMIAQGLVISMLMICPSRPGNGYISGLSKMTALVTALKQHDNLGGTYIVSTPKYIYQPLVRRRMADVSTAATKQVQNTFQLDFYAPLLSAAQAASAQNALMSKLSNGTQINGQPTWSGQQTTVGQSAGTSLGPVGLGG